MNKLVDNFKGYYNSLEDIYEFNNFFKDCLSKTFLLVQVISITCPMSNLMAAVL
jgi:hypothetical protein